MWILTLMLVAGLNTITLPDQKAADIPQLEGSVSSQCLSGAGQGRWEEAADACLRAVEEEPRNTELIRTAAEVLFRADRGEESARCWKKILDQEGWNCDIALKRANALWRGGRIDTAGAILSECAKKCTSTSEATLARLRFLEDFQRWDQAASFAKEAEEKFPTDCRISELRAVAEAQRGEWNESASAIARALKKGCPPFRWANLGEIPHHLDQPAYAEFLKPESIVAGLSSLDEKACTERLLLLKGRMTPAVIAPVLDTLLHRKTAQTRLVALGLITELGPDAGEAWETLLASDDFILRKYTLREIRKLRNPAFIPLLRKHLLREKSPGNLDLTRISLGELLYAQGKKEEGVRLVNSVQRDGYLFQPAQLLLARWAREAGSDAEEMACLEEAQAADPSTFLQVERLEELQRNLSAKAKAKKAEERNKPGEKKVTPATPEPESIQKIQKIPVGTD